MSADAKANPLTTPGTEQEKDLMRPSRINPAHIATRLASQPGLRQPLVRYDPAFRDYARLLSERHFEARLLAWVPGQGTDWHDHGGSAGASVTLQGTLTERQAIVDAQLLGVDW